MKFRDRTEAGTLLAKKLWAYADRPDLLVLALPRGGTHPRRLSHPPGQATMRKERHEDLVSRG